ncbi:MAG: MopE-related protein [Minicystis sp.]
MLAGCFEGLGNQPLPGTGGSGGTAITTGGGGQGGHGGAGSGGASTGGSGGTSGACTPGELRPCYTGPAGTEGVGLCKGGKQTCDGQGAFSGPCVGEVTPHPETCLTPVDDDCNGQVNEGGEGCACTPNAKESCYTGPAGTLGVGACAAGTRTCNAQGTAWGPCEDDLTPQPENCFDLLDNDCNGEVNEDGAGCICTPGEVVSCYTGPAGTRGVGACKAGTKTCSPQGDSFGPCTGEVTPQPETCNTPIDDDCNGQVNEGGAGCVCVPGSTASCYTGPAGTLGVGACKAGTKICNDQGTAYGPCAGDVTPQPETCLTAVDDNCNGQTNEGGAGCVCVPNAVVPCYTGPAGTAGVGVCKAGTAVCNAAGTAVGACSGEVLPQPESCFNAVDDDCNGQANDGCACTPGDVVTCYTGPAGTQGVGICTGGTRTCDQTGVFGPCTGEVTPQPETCLDLVDNDCNGQVNEGGAGCVCAPGSTASCYTGPAGTAGVGICKTGTAQCNTQGTAYGSCSGEVRPQAEVCGDLLDNDCNGQTNEGGAGCVCVPGTSIPCYSGPAGTAGVGACKAGVQVCNAQGTAYGSCTGEVLPQPETCLTAVDDNCNGQVNEGGAGCVCVPNATQPCYTGPAGTQGVGICTGGVSTCNGLGTAWGACAGQVVPQVEDCSTAADEDCDGKTPPCPGAEIWAKAFGSTLDEEGNVVAVDAADNVLLGGYTNNTVDYGCGPLTAGALDGALVVKFTAAGTCVWSKRYGVNAGVAGVTADASGNVFFTGNYNQSIDFGGGVLPNAGSTDGFLVKLDPGGNYVWAKGFGDAQAQTASAVATDAAGNVFTIGYFAGSMNLGGSTLSSMGSSDVYVAKFSPTGTHLWSKRFGDSANQIGKHLAVDPSGNVIIIGSFAGTIDFGGGPLTSQGLNDIFVAKLTSAGNHVWSKRFGDSADQTGSAVDTDATGNIVITGYFNGTIDLGAGPLTSLGVADIYLAKLESLGQPHLDARPRRREQPEQPLGLARRGREHGDHRGAHRHRRLRRRTDHQRRRRRHLRGQVRRRGEPPLEQALRRHRRAGRQERGHGLDRRHLRHRPDPRAGGLRQRRAAGRRRRRHLPGQARTVIRARLKQRPGGLEEKR